LRRCAYISSYVLAEAQGNEFSNGCVIKSEIFAVGSRDEWYSMIVIVTIIGIGNAPYKAPLTSTLLTEVLPCPNVLELVYIEFGTDPSPSDC
jgi:hypothetical protein